MGDSRAVICKNGEAKQLSVDHDPGTEKREIERRGGFVSNIPGNRLVNARVSNKVMMNMSSSSLIRHTYQWILVHIHHQSQV